jgi:predicted acyl esterase
MEARRGAATDSPVPGTLFSPYYTHGDGARRFRNLALTAGQFVRIHPARLVPTIGGTVLVRSGDGRRDVRLAGQCTGLGSEVTGRALAARPDALVFPPEPLSEDSEVNGAIEANLWILSDCPDTDFTINLIDVYPPSEDYPSVRDECCGRLRARPLPRLVA